MPTPDSLSDLSPSPSRIKNWLVNIGTALAAFAFSGLLLCVGGEAYFRYGMGLADYSLAKGYIDHSADRGWKLKPGIYRHFNLAAFTKTEITINSLGFRDEEILLTPAHGVRRITVVGDSITFGAALLKEERFTERLKALAGDSFEIVNISVEGYGQGQQILLLDELALQGYLPGEMVMVVAFSNDIIDNAGLSYGDLSPDPLRPAFSVNEEGVLTHSPPAKPPKRTAAAPTQYFFKRFILDRLETLLSRNVWITDLLARFGYTIRLPRRPGVIAGWYGDGWEDRWRRTEKIYDLMRNRKEAIGDATLVVAYVPSPFQVLDVFSSLLQNNEEVDPLYRIFLDDQDRPQRVMKESFQKLGLRFIDTTDALRKRAKKGDSPYFIREGHLNPLGADVVAAHLHRELIAVMAKDGLSTNEAL